LNSLGLKDTECEIIDREEFEKDNSDPIILSVDDETQGSNSINEPEMEAEGDEDIDIALLGTNGDGPSNWPHKREHCEIYTQISEQYCPKCFCSVCDKPVSACKSWRIHWTKCKRKTVININDNDDDNNRNQQQHDRRHFGVRRCTDCPSAIARSEPH